MFRFPFCRVSLIRSNGRERDGRLHGHVWSNAQKRIGTEPLLPQCKHTTIHLCARAYLSHLHSIASGLKAGAKRERESVALYDDVRDQPRSLKTHRTHTMNTDKINAPGSILYVSGNAEKRAEAQVLGGALGIELEPFNPAIEVSEIQGSIEEIARHKCAAAWEASDKQRPLLVEDVALAFEAFAGAPGAYVRDMLRSHSLEALYALLGKGSPRVTATSALAYTTDGERIHVFVAQAHNLVRNPAPFGHLPAWYPLAARDPVDAKHDDDNVSKAINPKGDAPCLHRVRSFCQLARFLSKADETKGTLTSPARENMARAVRILLENVGEDPNRDGLLDTPMRFAKAFGDLTQGYRMTVRDAIGDALFDQPNKGEMVVVRDIEFHSLCEHHLLPFMGHVHIGYMPTDKIIGLSKMSRVTNMFAWRLQVQERLTNEIAHCIQEATGASGVGVIAEATHMCMCMRGVSKTGSTTVTTTLLGSVKTDPQTRAQFMSMARPASIARL